MKILLDTNILLRLGDRGHAMHGEALATIDWLDENGHECIIVPQVLYEYWVVATRPREHNGLGMAVASADLAIAQWITVFRLLLDERGVLARWRNLVVANEVKGKGAHDARDSSRSTSRTSCVSHRSRSSRQPRFWLANCPRDQRWERRRFVALHCTPAPVVQHIGNCLCAAALDSGNARRNCRRVPVLACFGGKAC